VNIDPKDLPTNPMIPTTSAIPTSFSHSGIYDEKTPACLTGVHTMITTVAKLNQDHLEAQQKTAEAHDALSDGLAALGLLVPKAKEIGVIIKLLYGEIPTEPAQEEPKAHPSPPDPDAGGWDSEKLCTSRCKADVYKGLSSFLLKKQDAGIPKSDGQFSTTDLLAVVLAVAVEKGWKAVPDLTDPKFRAPWVLWLRSVMDTSYVAPKSRYICKGKHYKKLVKGKSEIKATQIKGAPVHECHFVWIRSDSPGRDPYQASLDLQLGAEQPPAPPA
jgi:hypothetical protein